MSGDPPPRPTRRSLLVGAGGGAVVLVGAVAAVEQGSLPGRERLDRLLGREGTAGVVPDVEPGRLVSGSFVSAARGGVRTGWAVAYPPGVPDRAALPLAVFLHGLHQSHRTAFSRARLGLDRFLAAEVHRTGRPFALAAVDGGTSYWHPHPGAGDAGAMVVDELLPRLARRGLATDRVALTGLSMGGYGALRLGGILGARRCAAVAVMSPALWTGPPASPSGFDSDAEYDRYTVFGHQRDLAGVPVHVDIGTDDPFYPAVRAYVAAFPSDGPTDGPTDGPSADRPVVGYQPGRHEIGYWRREAPRMLAFTGAHLTGAHLTGAHLTGA